MDMNYYSIEYVKNDVDLFFTFMPDEVMHHMKLHIKESDTKSIEVTERTTSEAGYKALFG